MNEGDELPDKMSREELLRLADRTLEENRRAIISADLHLEYMKRRTEAWTRNMQRRIRELRESLR